MYNAIYKWRLMLWFDAIARQLILANTGDLS
jgi:hypothetical protein